MVGRSNHYIRTTFQVVMVHLRNLLDEMVQEEESLKTKLMRNVETYGEELLKLCKELTLPPHEVTVIIVLMFSLYFMISM